MKYSTRTIAALTVINTDAKASMPIRTIANNAFVSAQEEQVFDTASALQTLFALPHQLGHDSAAVTILCDALVVMGEEIAQAQRRLEVKDVKAAPPAAASAAGMYAQPKPVELPKLSRNDSEEIKKLLLSALKDNYTVNTVDVLMLNGSTYQVTVEFANPAHKDNINSFLEAFVVDKFKENMPKFEMGKNKNICRVEAHSDKMFELLKDLRQLCPKPHRALPKND